MWVGRGVVTARGEEGDEEEEESFKLFRGSRLAREGPRARPRYPGDGGREEQERVLLSVRIEDAANEKSYRRLADFEHGNGKIAPLQSNLCHAQLPGRLLNKIKRLMMCHMTGDTQ